MAGTKTRGRQATKLKKGDVLYAYGDRGTLEVIALANRGTQAKVRNVRTGKTRLIPATPTTSLRKNYEMPNRLKRRPSRPSSDLLSARRW